MENIIEIEDLSFSYKDNLVFDNLNLSIKKQSFTTIIGPNGSGKTTLLKLILGLLKANTFIMIEDTPIIKENFSIVRNDISVVFRTPEDSFITEKVKDEIAFQLENLNFSKEEINEKIKDIAQKLNIKSLLNKSVSSLNTSEKTLVSFASALVSEPKILLIDGSLDNLDKKQKTEIINLLKKLNQKGLTIINTTNNVEECLDSTHIIILNKTAPIVSGTKEEVLNNEKIFSEYHLELPFVIELSNKLKFYSLIEKTYFDEEKLVEDLWK